MHGQWLGDFQGDLTGTLRIELEDRGSIWFGHAYVFYEPSLNMPGFLFELRFPKNPPYKFDITPEYLFSNGGVMPPQKKEQTEKELAQRFEEPLAATLHVELKLKEDKLHASYSDDGGNGETIVLSPSLTSGVSKLEGRSDLTNWDQFREWAVDQKPRKYVFRGQSAAYKLTSTFHRTWRNDLNSWINTDVRTLYGAIADKVSHPLELGKLEHNAAIWNLLQHHGYPTPLIDWTYSPFVAAFFAFHQMQTDPQKSPRIFIFDQEEWSDRYGQAAFTADPAPPQVVLLESLAFGNPRSGPQQALSTVVNVADVEDFIGKRERSDQRSYLTVCDLSPSEQPKIMRELELMGITYGSLFPGLDGICRDMKDRLFNKDHWQR